MKKLKVIIGSFATLIAIAPWGLKATPYNPVVALNNSDVSVIAKPIFKVGNPYTINGINYKPSLNANYDELGIASWYGEGFHGKLTSNGEIFNQRLVTAASTVLPLPSIVEITNLDNGKKLLVRVNDRGPYSNGRIIDVSERAAELLEFKDKGTARVRVRIVPDLSKKVAEQMPNYKDVMASLNVSTANPSNALSTDNDIMSPSTTPATATTSIPNSQLASADEDATLSNSNAKVIQVNDSSLKQVSLLEPNSVQQYVPRGVFVQVGAFDSHNTRIKENIDSLSKVGVVTLQNVDINGKNVLRVRVGPYGSIEDASKIKSSLIRLGYKDPRVVIEE